MATSPGTRLGPYEILSAIGAGGMGEVYRARDARLNRVVAIKILPAHLADKPELRERFEREARTIASLNHPHICTLYDIGHQDSTDYLVLEFLEGETLAERLKKGPLPLEQVLQYAIEIADALDKAHRKGITHRDLKPGNIMLTKSGAKLLDFGVAKLKQESGPGNPSLSTLPTASDSLTAEGTILGTLQYMAPEQVEGKSDQIDARTDIFAFGVVVYEMATGRRAFEGKSQASLIAKILETDPPPMSLLQPMTPPALDRVVKKCLAKEQERRWQDAGDLSDELRWIAGSGSQASAVVPAPARSIRKFRWRLLGLGAGTLLLVAAVAGMVAWNLRPMPPQTLTRTVIDLPPGDQLAAFDYPAIAISPEGSQIAYVAFHSGTRQIYLRALDNLEARPLAGTDGANTPFFSPDGQWLGFFAGGKLKKISVSGGPAVSLGNAAVPSGAVWGQNGTIIFSPTNTSVLEKISNAGGTAQVLTRLVKGEVLHAWPELLPGSKTVLFSTGLLSDSSIVAQSLDSGERRELVPSGTAPRYVNTGHLIYAQGGTLMAVPFDPQRLQVTGTAVSMAQGVLQAGFVGAVQYVISETGSLAYVPGGSLAGDRLVWVSRNGKEEALTAAPHHYIYPRISPDGRRIAVGIAEGQSQVWLYDLARDALTEVVTAGTVNVVPAWTPDAKRLAFTTNREGPQNIFWQPTDSSGSVERLTSSEYPTFARSFSRDGQFLAYVEINPTTGYDIWVMKLADHRTEPFLRSPFNEGVPEFSADGHWLSYVSDETGRWEVYLQPYPGPGGKYQISTEGGTEPVWNPKGNELFYRSGDKMMAVDVTTQPNLSIGKPRMLFRGPYLPTLGTLPYYDVSPDGRRFLMIKLNEESSSSSLTKIVVVQNWFEELKQKVPTGKK